MVYLDWIERRLVNGYDMLCVSCEMIGMAGGGGGTGKKETHPEFG
jgi:hypothetical protein